MDLLISILVWAFAIFFFLCNIALCIWSVKAANYSISSWEAMEKYEREKKEKEARERRKLRGDHTTEDPFYSDSDKFD